MTGVEVREASGERELQAALAVRRAVFVDEQDVPVDLELDGRDGDSVHLVAVRDGAVLGTCRLLPGGATVLLGRLAVAREARRQGIAGLLLEAAEDWARAHGARRLSLSAQTYAEALYVTAGYERRGVPFMEAGIEHVHMERELG